MSEVTAEGHKTALAGVPTAKTDPDAPGWRGLLNRGNFRDYGLMIALALIMLFFEYATKGVLFEPLNLTNLILQNSYVVVMALGMLLVIVAGHIDLSIGSVVGFVGALAAVLMVQGLHLGLHLFGLDLNMDTGPIDYVTSTIICLIVGGAIGAAQGYWVAYFKIPSFIVTLAGMLVFRGLTLAVLNGASVGPFPNVFQLLAKGFVPEPLVFHPDLSGLQNSLGLSTDPAAATSGDLGWSAWIATQFVDGIRIAANHPMTIAIGLVIALVLIATSWRRRINRQRQGVVTEPLAGFILRDGAIGIVAIAFAFLMASYRGLPNVLIIMFVLVMLYRFVTNKTTIGRRIYALGGNIKAAKLSGIKTERLTFFTFINMGVLAGLAGMIFAARLNSATPKGGLGFELDVIAACFIGGASASGGVGKVTGVVIGAFIIGVMNNGMSIMGIGIDYQQVIKGLVLLGAVCLDVYNKNKAG